MSEDQSRTGSRLWTDPRREDEHQPWLAPPTSVTAPAPREPKPPSPEELAARRERERREARRRTLRIAAAVAAVLVVFLGAESLLDGDGSTSAALPEAPTGAAPGDERSETVRAVYAAVSESVVNVRVSEGSRSGTGTGFFVDGAGTIVTNAHVVGDAERATVRLDDNGRTVDAEVVGSDRSSDLAVLRVDRDAVDDIKPLALADSSKVRVGDIAIAIGYPLGLDRTATTGIVSGLGRQIEAPNGFSIDEVIQTDAPINPGNSGGPLLDSRGRVIGVNSQIATSAGGGIGFAVPSDTVREVLPKLRRGATIERAWLGVEAGDAPGGGAVIARLTPGGPAETVGLQPGDVVRSVGGRRIGDADELIAAVDRRTPGQAMELEIERGGASTDIDVQLGTRPERIP